MIRGRRHRAATFAGAGLSSPGCGAALLLIGSLYAGPGWAQNAPSTAKPSPGNSQSAADRAEEEEEHLDDILVTAHRQHGAIASDVPPEVKLNSTAIRALGAADLEEVLEDLAPEIKNGQAETGKNANQVPIVLVNGQRIAGFDTIESLPPEAVRRIEIFPEKVALQYGYRPDQRVVNVVLRTHYRALTVMARDTLAPENWRGIYRGKIDYIRIGPNSHWNIDFDYRHMDPVFSGSTLGGPPGSPGSSDHVPPYTTGAQDDRLTVSGDGTRNFGTTSAELTGRLQFHSIQSRLGLSAAQGGILEQEGLSDLINGPLNRIDNNVDGQASLTLNGKLEDDWRWSFIGKLDQSARQVRTSEASKGSEFAPILLPSPALLGQHCHGIAASNCSSTTGRDASGDVYLNGNVVPLPAGPITAALRAGVAFSGIHSVSSFDQSRVARARDESDAQANLDFPITSRNSPIGKLSVGVNGEARHVSAFGTLSTIGSTIDWSPAERLTILATFSREDQAPTLMQLDEALLATPDLREFDFVNGTTAIVQRLDGGDGALKRERSRIANLRVQFSPFRTTNLQLSAEYTIERMRDPIVNLSAATPEAEAAFPDRFTRSAGGFLTGLDATPLNLARRDRQQLRWGVNYSTPFGSAWTEKSKSGQAKPSRSQLQLAFYHTWRFQDDVVLRDGLPGLNLLGHDLINDRGGTPTHQLELQTTLAMRSWSADINALWQSPTKAFAGPSSAQTITFSQGVTLNLRVQINLAEQRWLTRLLPWIHGNLNLSAENLLGAHLKVHNSLGGTPAAYSENYLNPTGRTFRITLRKRFR